MESSSSCVIISAYSTQTKLWRAAAAALQSRTSWWVDTQEHRDGLTSKTMRGKTVPKNSRDWARPVSTKTEAECAPPFLTQREDSSEDFSELNSENLHQQQPVFLFPVFLLEIRCTAHCHLQCASANLANSASHTSFNRLFFAGS